MNKTTSDAAPIGPFVASLKDLGQSPFFDRISELCAEIERLRAALAAPKSAAPQIDTVTVPIEPTTAMIERAWHTWRGIASYDMIRSIYKAMLAAAPESAAPQDSQDSQDRNSICNALLAYYQADAAPSITTNKTRWSDKERRTAERRVIKDVATMLASPGRRRTGRRITDGLVGAWDGNGRRVYPAPDVAGLVTKRTAESIAKFVAKFPGLGEDVFVHETDYNQAENGRIALKDELERLAREVETQRMQAAACMTATVQNTRASIADRIGRDHPYWTQCYADVCASVNREIAERERAEAADRKLAAVCEIYAGMDGIPIPETAPEGYLVRIIRQMYEAAKGQP